MRQGSLCGLGQGAPNPALTTIGYFRDEYAAHVRDHVCPAGECRALISYVIIEDRCKGCGICLRACPSAAISGEKGKLHSIDAARCTQCGNCLDVCPARFAAVVKVPSSKVEKVKA